jgi:stress response protein SCP2
MDSDQPTGTEADVGDGEVSLPQTTADTGDAPKVQPSTPRITVTFRAQDGVEVPFTMKKTSKLGRAMVWYRTETLKGKALTHRADNVLGADKAV